MAKGKGKTKMRMAVLPEIVPRRPNTLEIDFSLPVYNDPARLVEWRTLLGIGQTELAAIAQVSQTLISALETGREKFSEPSRTKIWTAIFEMVEKKAIADATKISSADAANPFAPLRAMGLFKTPLELKDEEIELLKRERDLARERYNTVKQLLDMKLVDRCVELEKRLAAALQANADYAKLFALKGAAVAGDELQSEIESRQQLKKNPEQER